MAGKKLLPNTDLVIPASFGKTKFDRKDSEKFMFEMQKSFSMFSVRDKLDFLKLIGVGTKYLTCPMCGEPKSETSFYQSTDVNMTTKRSRICKDCTERLVYPRNVYGEPTPPTAESIKYALEYLDKPWIESIWATAQKEPKQKQNQAASDVWGSYIKNISMKNFDNKRWRDSDIFKNVTNFYIEKPSEEIKTEVDSMYEINKKQVVHALGYDPFASVAEEDKPQMYSKLLGFLDESTSEDEMKLGAIIEIVQAFNQTERLNYTINQLQKNPDTMVGNSATIKALADTKNKIFSSALALAKDNGISFINSNKNTKGADTWTGKVKELKEMNLRGAEMNSYDIKTAEGIQQVADASINAIFKELNMDENDYTDIIAIQKRHLQEAQKQCEEAQEEARIYKRENKDLKDYMRKQGLMDEEGKLIL